LQRLHRLLRGRQRRRRRERAEPLLDLTHQRDRAADLAARRIGEAAFADLVLVFCFHFFVFNLSPEQEDEVRPYRALFGRDRAGGLHQRVAASDFSRAWSRSIFRTIIAWLSA
jgi:hypothetical protein